MAQGLEEERAGTTAKAGPDIIYAAIDQNEHDLKEINRKIFENPELAFEEHQAHDNIVKLLKSKGFAVTQRAYGIETSFEAEYGSGGRVVVFNAEYDALPGIGHACGHNLIATASIAAFLGVAEALKKSGKEGRVRLLGTPAEENKGGKRLLVAAGAYKDVDAALMLHPGAQSRHNGRSGTAYAHTLANEKLVVRFKGKAAHASMYPFNGVNALDAVMLSYSAISMLRQQIRPYERIHGIVNEGGKAPNVIPDSASLNYVIRSNTKKEAMRLKDRVLKCFEGAAIATGCDWEIDMNEYFQYSDLRPNKKICTMFAEAMDDLNSPVNCDLQSQVPGLGSTDMGNVSYVCPGFHGFYGIPTEEGAYNHTPGFTKFAGKAEAHDLTIVAAKGMATAGWRVLESELVAQKVWQDFDDDEETQIYSP